MERFAPLLEKLAAKNAEQAFALLEKLSELERVQLLGRGALGLDDPATVGQFRAAAPHLAEIDRLRAAVATAPAADRDYLQLRLQQEQAVVDDLFGAKLERIPSYYAQAGDAALRLAAASVELSRLSQADNASDCLQECASALRYPAGGIQQGMRRRKRWHSLPPYFTATGRADRCSGDSARQDAAPFHAA